MDYCWQGPTVKDISSQRLNLVSRWNISNTYPKFDIILFSTRERDVILLARDEGFGDCGIFWYQPKTTKALHNKLLDPNIRRRGKLALRYEPWLTC